MRKHDKPILALFYCQNTPESTESVRQALEDEYGGTIRFFPLPCSGRLESLHLLRALEEFADAAYVVTCPKGACRYFEGNRRARKRVDMVRDVISIIGLEEERAGIVVNDKENLKPLSRLAQEIKENTDRLGISRVFSKDPVVPKSERKEIKGETG